MKAGVRFTLLAALAAAAAGVLAIAFSSGGPEKRTARSCPPGQRVVRESGENDGGSGDYESHFRGKCAPLRHPESAADIAKFNEFAGTRQGADSPKAFAKGLRQRDRLAAQAAAENIPGTGGSWTPYGKGPLIGDDPTYPATLGDGFGKMNGRVSDFAYVDST